MYLTIFAAYVLTIPVAGYVIARFFDESAVPGAVIWPLLALGAVLVWPLIWAAELGIKHARQPSDDFASRLMSGDEGVLPTVFHDERNSR